MTAIIFLLRTRVGADDTPLVEFAAVEHAENAARYEAAGFCRCSYAAFRDAWQRRDAQYLAALHGETAEVAPPPEVVPPAEQPVQPARYGARIYPLPAQHG